MSAPAPAEGGAQAFLSTIGRRLGKTVGLVGGMGTHLGGGSGALNQLLALMDGIDEPPMMPPDAGPTARTPSSTRSTSCRDAVGKAQPAPRAHACSPDNNIYFIGACNVSSMCSTRRSPAGAVGRQIRFWDADQSTTGSTSSTTYLAKVVHDPLAHRQRRSDELARITNGYSPAMIEQVCSMALTYAHHEEWDPVPRATTSSRR